MYLKREPPKSLPKPPHLKNCFSTRERPARTPPSTFLFLPIHFSNSPEIVEISHLRSPGGSSKPMHPNTIGCRFTVPVRSFRGAQSRRKRTARRWPVYRLRPVALSTGNRPLFGPVSSKYPRITWVFRSSAKRRLNLCRAALRPYSWVVLRVQVEGWNRSGGIKPPSIRPINEALDPLLTGLRSTGIVPALIQAAC